MAVFYNQASLTYGGTTTHSNITVGEINEQVKVTKTALSGTYRAGDRVAYVISIVNSGAAALSGLTLRDDLGSYTVDGDTYTPLDYDERTVRYYIDGVLQPAPGVTLGPPLTLEGISIPAGGNVLIVYETEVNGFAPMNVEGEITNTVTVSGEALEPSITASETIAAENSALLSITKSIEPKTVSGGERVTYTFVIQNTGNTAAEYDAVLRDTFNPRLTSLEVTLNGATISSPASYTYNETTGVFETVPGVIKVPAASYSQNPATGLWEVTPGMSVLTVSGII